MNEKTLKRWQLALGWLIVAAMYLAVFLSGIGPTLTYTPDGGGEVKVSCKLGGAVTGDSDYPGQLNYETDDDLDSAEFDSEDVERDCARADAARLRNTVWVLAAGLMLVVGFAAACILRAVYRRLPPSAVESSATQTSGPAGTGDATTAVSQSNGEERQ